MDIETHRLKERLDVAREAAQKAGDIIVNNSTKMTVLTKSSSCDLVTQVDKYAEQVIVQLISEHFPEDLIVGEEDSSQSSSYQDLEGELIPNHIGCWFIDPLDGTTNFVHGYPLVNVSIGYCFGGIPRLGVIFNPFLGEMYEALEGHGAFCNEKRIFVDSSTGLDDCLLVNNIGHVRQTEFVEESTARITKWLHGGLRGYRSSGSAAQNMSHVAGGRVSCYYEHLYGGPWDVCAGYIIVKEAGGILIDPKDESIFQLRYGKGSICCGNKRVVEEVLRTAGRPKFI